MDMEPLYTIHTDTERSRLVAYRHLGDRYFYPAERHRRCIEHHADYRQGTHTRVRHTQSAGCKAFFHPSADYCGKRYDYHFFGYIGMVAGIGVTEWMNSAFGTQTADAGMFQARMFSDPTVDIGIAIQATLTLIVAGTLAGFFPAKKAVSISPIEALRAD